MVEGRAMPLDYSSWDALSVSDDETESGARCGGRNCDFHIWGSQGPFFLNFLFKDGGKTTDEEGFCSFFVVFVSFFCGFR